MTCFTRNAANSGTNASRASQTARRKAIYLELHPDTAEHVAGGKGNATGDNLSSVPSFAASTAAMTGKDERTVQRDAERGAKVIPEVIDMITRDQRRRGRTHRGIDRKIRGRHARSRSAGHRREKPREELPGNGSHLCQAGRRCCH